MYFFALFFPFDQMALERTALHGCIWRILFWRNYQSYTEGRKVVNQSRHFLINNRQALLMKSLVFLTIPFLVFWTVFHEHTTSKSDSETSKLTCPFLRQFQVCLAFCFCHHLSSISRNQFVPSLSIQSAFRVVK